jgi:UrcA family protein
MPQSHRVPAQLVACGLLACALGACASQARIDASATDGIPQRRVSYADLDLESRAGARVLLRRLKVAADQVCELPNQRDLAQHLRWRECYAHALAEAVRQVNRSQLTTLYRASVPTPMLRQADAGH